MNMPETYESLNEHPPISNVQRMAIIPFVNSQVVLAAGGRLIVTSYGLTRDRSKSDWSVGDHLRNFGFMVAGEPEVFDKARSRLYRIAYINSIEVCRM